MNVRIISLVLLIVVVSKVSGMEDSNTNIVPINGPTKIIFDKKNLSIILLIMQGIVFAKQARNEIKGYGFAIKNETLNKFGKTKIITYNNNEEICTISSINDTQKEKLFSSIMNEKAIYIYSYGKNKTNAIILGTKGCNLNKILNQLNNQHSDFGPE